jgi:Tfp pilus assembly protein PilF
VSGVSKASELVAAGLALQRNGRLREAAAAYQQALVIHPKFGPALHHLGVNMVQQNLPDMGRTMLEQALVAGEEGANLRMQLAQLWERTGQTTKAVEHYRVAAELTPTDASIWGSLARALGRCGDMAGSRAAWQSLLQQHPTSEPALRALLRDAYQQNDLASAIAYFERASAVNPQLAKDIYLGVALPQQIGSAVDPTPLLQVEATVDDDIVRRIVEGADLHIIDDFLPEPNAAREWARHLTYRERGNYPGLQTGPQPCYELMQQLANRLGRRIKWISPDNGVVRLTLADANARTDIHVDDESAVETQTYAAVLYLTQPDHCLGGTSFWRHRGTNWIKRPDEPTIRAAGYADFKTFLRRETPALQEKSFDALNVARDAWQRLFTLPMRYNRLVLYKGNYFHAIDSIFGRDFDDGRLTRLFTFELF